MGAKEAIGSCDHRTHVSWPRWCEAQWLIALPFPSPRHRDSLSPYSPFPRKPARPITLSLTFLSTSNTAQSDSSAHLLCWQVCVPLARFLQKLEKSQQRLKTQLSFASRMECNFTSRSQLFPWMWQTCGRISASFFLPSHVFYIKTIFSRRTFVF